MSNKEIEKGLELRIQFDMTTGLVPAIAHDYKTGKILMLGYANQAALDETINSGYATFWSRSRNELWKKGETSGNLLRIREVLVDCDQDALIYKVEREKGGACHTTDRDGQARESCFYRRITPGSRLEFLEGMH